MRKTEKLTMVIALLEGVETSLSLYEQEARGKNYPPVAGYDNLAREDGRESIKRRILVAREELLKISKSL